MSTIITTSKRCLLPFIVVAIAASLSGCNSSPTSRNISSQTPVPVTTPNSTSSPPLTTTPNSASSPVPSQNPSVAQLRAKSPNKESSSENTPDSTSQAATSKTTNVTLYTSDVQCQKLIPEKVAVPAEEPVKSAVGKILAQRDTSDFGLSGYRVSVKNGIATVDLRISPESKRQIASLSSCEQFALFGSVRKTLTSNNQWKIKEVRFTERGEEIVL
ncbi:sporulation/spore germination protein [Nostoc sp. UHCC 0302]|uniref:sporulation/spore germination protein n=1 Tax=Nostoc sp. UHCC 0302 TaxID=3134896 RepID=UPI00311CA1E2